MWNLRHTESPSKSFSQQLPPQASASTTQAIKSSDRIVDPASVQATIGKGLIVTGEISGSESLFIDGIAEGSINLPGHQVTVGRNGQVTASIIACDVVVLGKICGNVIASNRVDIRAEGAVTGDVIAARLSIEDGAFFKGSIDISNAQNMPLAAAKPAKKTLEPQKTFLVVRPEVGKRRLHPLPLSA